MMIGEDDPVVPVEDRAAFVDLITTNKRAIHAPGNRVWQL